MIKTLEIKNVALIGGAVIEFDDGLNVLSGETGSGKSVIIDAVNFVLGAKADKTMIRHGETSCSVTAVFTIDDNKSAQSVLNELGVEYDDEIIVSRKFSVDGKSSIRVNGEQFSSSMLKNLTTYLIDVHGQSEHYSLLKPAEQLKILDKFCGEKLDDLKRECAEICAKLKNTDEEMKKFGGNERERAIKADVLKFQIEEIRNADLKENEEEELLVRRKKIQSAEKLAEAFSICSGALSGENGAIDAINQAVRAIGSISGIDEKYAELYERLKSASFEVEDIAETITDFAEDTEFNEGEADETENRLEVYKTLKRKYGADFGEINAFYEKSVEEYDKLVNFDAEYAKQAEIKQKLLNELNRKNSQISAIRREFSVKFCQNVTEQLHLLGMKRAVFKISFSDVAAVTDAPYTPNGNDEVTFEFSANLGEPVKPLSKIISGGEMSRFMLALKTIISGYQDISTYIFDEIDVGISGATAETVAKKFADISRNVQIIAISHLPQVCAMSDCALKISKSETDGKTFTVVKKLNRDEKIAEITRIMSGEKISEIAVKHAQETVNSCDEYKLKIGKTRI